MSNVTFDESIYSKLDSESLLAIELIGASEEEFSLALDICLLECLNPYPIIVWQIINSLRDMDVVSTHKERRRKALEAIYGKCDESEHKRLKEIIHNLMNKEDNILL